MLLDISPKFLTVDFCHKTYFILSPLTGIVHPCNFEEILQAKEKLVNI